MTQYLLSICYPEGASAPAPESLQTIMKDVGALREEMQAAGVWVFGAGLLPASTATVVRVREGEILTTDGPFAEGKEYVGGFTIIKAADLDAALLWGSRLARATTTPVEVRPLR